MMGAFEKLSKTGREALYFLEDAGLDAVVTNDTEAPGALIPREDRIALAVRLCQGTVFNVTVKGEPHASI